LRSDHRFRARGLPRHSHLVPPPPNAGHGKLSGVMADPNGTPPLVLGRVVDAVGTALVPPLLPKTMGLDPPRLPPGFPLPARTGEIADVFLLFRVHGDHR